MPEQFQVAAYRHFKTAELLADNSMLDDAAYHLGVAGENAVKHAMQEAGLEVHWDAVGINKNTQPMRGHWGRLQAKLVAEAATINLFSSGRRSAPLKRLIASGSITEFSGWSIDIRYADSTLVPVSTADHQRWYDDAQAFLIDFAL